MPQGIITLPFGGGTSGGGSGGGSPYMTKGVKVIISADSPTHTINEAVTPVVVFRGNMAEPNYTFSNHVWTFANPLSAGEELIFVYNKIA